MPTELEEVRHVSVSSNIFIANSWSPQLVGFVAHPNPQIRLVAAENLVPYSTAEPSVFKASQLQPIKNLKVLVRDHPVSPQSQ